MLNKKQIFARKPKIEKVFIESMNDHVHVKEFIVSERNKLRDSGASDIHTITLILGVCDEKGEPLFTIEDEKDIGEMPQVLADELLTAVINFNDQKDKAQAAKN